MKITLTGATGFLGTRLSELLRSEGHDLRFLTREPRGRANHFAWDVLAGPPPEASLAGAQAVIHLAGEPVAQRWTSEAKARILRSRVDGTRHLVQALSTLSPRPEVLISASAVGFYGPRGDDTLTEAAHQGSDFLARVCVEWEQTASLAASLGIRIVRLRTGIVLGRDGGALAKMLPPFRFGLGGPLAGGQQWMPWIHVDDWAGMVAWALRTTAISGPLNVIAPNSVKNQEFTKALGAALHRPAFLPVPLIGLKLFFGEMATMLVESQRVVPAAAQTAGFQFRYPHLNEALRGLV